MKGKANGGAWNWEDVDADSGAGKGGKDKGGKAKDGAWDDADDADADSGAGAVKGGKDKGGKGGKDSVAAKGGTGKANKTGNKGSTGPYTPPPSSYGTYGYDALNLDDEDTN